MALVGRVALVALTALVLAAPALAQQQAQAFTRPTVHDFRLDFCRHAGSDCGQPAADLFCQQMGFERAEGWTPSGPISGQTLIFGDGKLCSGPQCSGFNTIRCVAGQAPAPGPVLAMPSAPVVVAPQPRPQETPSQTVPPPQVVGPAPVPVQRPPNLHVAVPSPGPFPLPRTRPQPPAAIAPGPTPVTSLADLTLTFNPALASIPSPPPRTAPLSGLNSSAEAVTARWAATLQDIGTYPEGASIFKCLRSDCEFAVTPDIEIDPNGPDQTQVLYFSVMKVPHAGGAIWQVSTQPFPSFGNGADADYDPPGMVFSGRQDKLRNSYLFDFAALAENVPPPPANVRSTGTIFYVRVLPAAFNGIGQIVGQPSNVMRIYYGAEAPKPPPLELPTPQVTEQAPPVELEYVEFKPYRWIQWPAGCLTWEAWRDSQDKSFFEQVGDVFTDIWNYAAEAYQWAKGRVVDIAAALTFGIIPDSVLEFALDAALASAGIPPDIPNLDEMLSGGLDHIAGEIAKTAVSQIPSGEVAGKLGELAGSAVVNELAQQGEDALRERLQQELEARSREALVRTADELAKSAHASHGDTLCQDRFIPPAYRVTVRNTSAERIRDFWVWVYDTEGVYHGVRQDLDLWPYQTMALMVVPDPQIIDVWDNRNVRMEPMATDENISNWWNEILFKTETSIAVSFKGDLVCFGNCTRTNEQVFRSPPQLLTEPYTQNMFAAMGGTVP